MRSNILFEVTVKNGSIPVTLRMASAAASADGCQVNDLAWTPLITKRFQPSGSWTSEGVLDVGSVNHGSLSFRMSSAYENEVWSSYDWNGGTARIWVGNDGDPFSAYTQQFEGTVSSLDRQGIDATVGLLGPDALLDKDTLTLAYLGTGGAEGPASQKGKLKPRAIGFCQSVEPVLIDPAYWVYQVHAYGAVTSIKPYEYAQALDPARNKGDAATYAALIGMTLVPGEWATCLAQGMFRLGATPKQKVSADVQVSGSQTVPAIVADLLTLAGIPANKQGSFAAFNGMGWNAYVTSQTSIGDLARQCVRDAGGMLFADGTGTWQAMNYFATKTPVVLNADRSAMPLVKSIRELPAAAAIGRVRVGHTRCWGVHSSTDVSPALREAADQAAAAAATATAADGKASTADGKATAASNKANEVDQKAATGFAANLTYNFNGTVDGWIGRNCTVAAGSDVMTITNTADDPQIYANLSRPGKDIQVIRVRLRPLGANPSWQGTCFYGNANHGETPLYKKDLPNPGFVQNEWKVVEWDMSALTAGGSDFVDSPNINRLRFDFSGDTSRESWEVDWIQLGVRMNATYGAPVGSTVGSIAVSDLVTKVNALDAAGLTDTVAPAVPTGLALSSTLTDAGVTFKAAWNAVSASDLAGYVIALKEGSGNYVEFTASSNSFERTALPRNTAFTGKVLAYDKAGNRSAFSSEVTMTTARDTVAPSPVTGVTVSTTFNTAFVSWTNPADLDLKRVELRLVDSVGSGNVIATQSVEVAPGTKGSATWQNLTKGTTYSCYLLAYDTSGNEATVTNSGNFTTAGGIAAGDFTPGLQPIQTVSALPAASGYTGPAVVLLSTDGKLYRYANGAWSKEVPYGDVTGKPTSLSAINSTESAKLTGIKENAGNILDTRNANELPSYYYGKGLGEYQEFKGENFAGSGSVGYGHLITTAQWTDPSGGPVKQTLTDSNNAIFERASTSVSAWGAWGKNYNSAQKPRLGNDLVSSVGNILTDLTVLNANQQWSEVAGTGKPADNATVGAPAGTNVGSTAATTIETRANDPATRINNHTVTIDGGKLTAGTVDTNQLKAGSVKTAQLAIGSMTELNPDPGFRDTKFWRNDGIYPGDLGTTSGTNNGYYSIHSNDINTALGTSHYCMLWEQYFKTSGRQHLISTRRYNIKAGTTYQISALVRNASNQTMRVLCRMYDVANATLADAELRWTTGEWSTKSGQFVAPAGVNNFELFVYNAGGVMWAGNCQIADFQIIEAAGSTAIKDGAITTDKLTAKAVTANKLSVNSRLFSAAELNVRYKDGVLSWDAGNIVYVNDAGGAVYNSVPAGSRTGSGYLCYKPGNPTLEVVADYGIRANPDYFTIAYYDGVTGLTLIGGTSTRINGSDIQTGTLSADRIVSKSIGAGQIAANAITANEIKTGTLTAAQMAAGAITATVLAVGNSDSIVGDAFFTDAKWWSGGVADARLTVGDTGMVESRRELLLNPGGGIDVSSMEFPADPGATYRINVGVYTYPDFNGSFRPLIHVPNHLWMSLKGAGASIDPGDTSATHNFTAAGAYDRRSFVFTNPETANAGRWQFRFLGSWTGKAAFTVTIVRVGDATLIKDGAVETKHITVGTLDGDRIKAATIDAAKIKAGSIEADRLALGVKERVYTNLINAPFWGKGDMNATPYWNSNNGGANSWYVGLSPTGGAEPLLKMVANTNDANGGWNTTITESDGWSKNKAYRYYTWFFNESGNNSYYHGCDNVQSLTGGDIGNPYFFAGGKAGLTYGKWYLFVGVVHPAGSLMSDSGVSGAYDPVTGQRIIPGTDYRWRPTATNGNFRSYQFYGDTGGVAYYTKPVVEEIVAGQTPAIRSLFQNLDYAQNINGGTTLISPGRILISNTTSLDDWRTGTEINGSAIKTKTVAADKISTTSLSAISANVGTVTAGMVRSTSGEAYFDLDNARIVFNRGGVMKVQGSGFGSANQFIEWFGPTQSNFANCTEANATYYLKTNGSAYFGGSLSAGVIKNAAQTTSTGATAQVSTGSFGSNGRTRRVVLSYVFNYSANSSQLRTGGPGGTSATISLRRNGTEIQQLQVSGSWQAFLNNEGNGTYRYAYTEEMGGSITVNDNSGGSNVEYSAVITARTRGPGPAGNIEPYTEAMGQTISITSTEE